MAEHGGQLARGKWLAAVPTSISHWDNVIHGNRIISASLQMLQQHPIIPIPLLTSYDAVIRSIVKFDLTITVYSVLYGAWIPRVLVLLLCAEWAHDPTLRTNAR